jgi:coenzyme PQQ precursor peptide PqqA
MNDATETWITPDFEDLAASMECTAYSETLE